MPEVEPPKCSRRWTRAFQFRLQNKLRQSSNPCPPVLTWHTVCLLQIQMRTGSQIFVTNGIILVPADVIDIKELSKKARLPRIRPSSRRMNPPPTLSMTWTRLASEVRKVTCRRSMDQKHYAWWTSEIVVQCTTTPTALPTNHRRSMTLLQKASLNWQNGCIFKWRRTNSTQLSKCR